MSMNRQRESHGFHRHLFRTSALAMLVVLLLLGAGVRTLPHAVGEQRRSDNTADAFGVFRIPTELRSIDGEVRLHRVTAGSGNGSPPAQAGAPTIVYSNTSAVDLFPPGAFFRIADDVRTTAGCGCPLITMELLISGGGDGTGPGFGVEYEIYDDCPSTVGNVIAGTDGSATLPDDGLHLLNIDYSVQSPFLPRNVWVAVRFDTGSAGWVVGTPAETGFTFDSFDFPGLSCGANFAGTPYSGFHVSLTCDGAGNGPSTPVDPNPQDEAINVDLDQDLAWNDPGDGGLVAPRSADAPTAATIATVTAGWDAAIPAGQECDTFEHYVAKGGSRGSGNVAGGSCSLGVCDDPTARDAFVPDGNMATKAFRMHMHVFCFDDSTGCLSDIFEVYEAINTLNSFCAPYKIQFDYATSFHFDTESRDLFPFGEEVAAMKTQYAVDPAATLNVYIVNLLSGGNSYGTYPWSSDALTATGGIIMEATQFSATDTTLTHEVGHNLGLFHTNHPRDLVGNRCLDPCVEYAGSPSDTTGDLCSDTEPTPVVLACATADGEDPCNELPWGPTDFHNHMTGSTCRYEFSAQQSGRMHCWTEDVLSGWLLPQCVATYDVLLDTVNPPIVVACSALMSSSCDPGTLAAGTTYYWQVEATNELGTTIGPVWSFTTFEDCNGNGVDDAQDISGGTSLDCQPNGIPDECDVAVRDCNGNNIPDECDPDGDGDGIPDDCESARPRPDDETGLGIVPMVIACNSDADCPASESQCVSDDDGNFPGTCYIPANRWLSIKPNPDNAGALTARRVSLVTGPGPLDRVALGWVEDPAEVVIAGPEPTNQLMAGLSATAVYADWSTMLAGSAVRMGDCSVSPGNSYVIQAIMQGAEEADEASYSEELLLRTIDAWGDVAGAGPYPDGVANLVDAQEEVLGFQGRQNIPKWRLDLVGNGNPDNAPDFTIINLLDVSAAVDAFQGNPYPYSAPCDCAGQACP